MSRNFGAVLWVLAVAVGWCGAGRVSAQQVALEFRELPELVNKWSKPLSAAGGVAVQPDGKKALFVDAQTISVFEVSTGKVLRVIPHSLPNFSSVICTEEDLAVETGQSFSPYEMHVAKIAAPRRSVELQLRSPCYAGSRPLMAGVGKELCQVFSSDRGQWGVPKWSFGIDEPLEIGFVDADRLLFAVSRTGEFRTLASESGEAVSGGQLGGWPGQFRLGSGSESRRRVAVVGASNRLLVADGESILVYDALKGTSLPAIQSVAYPVAVTCSPQTSRVIVRVGVSKLADRTREGKRRAVVVDASSGEVNARFREVDVLNSSAIVPGGEAVVCVIGSKDKRGRMEWAMELLEIPHRK